MPKFSMRSWRALSLLPRRVATIQNQRFVRFGLVGGSGVLVRTAVLTAVVMILRGHYVTAAIIGTEASILTNFALNDYWTFGDVRHEKPYIHRVTRYHVVTLGGFALSIAAFALLTGIGIHYLLANLVSIGVATFFNYGLSSRFAWSTRKRNRSINASPDAVA